VALIVLAEEPASSIKFDVMTDCGEQVKHFSVVDLRVPDAVGGEYR
jgi:hypothetical protein